MTANTTNTINGLIRERQRRAYAKKAKALTERHMTLLLHGHVDVATLVDWLCNQREGQALCLLPALLSPEPFPYGTLSPIRVTRHEGVLQADGSGSCHQLRLDGPILPVQAHNLVRLARQLDPASRIHMKPYI